MELLKDKGPPEIEASEISLGKKLGQGQFGAVYRGVCRGKEVAIKLLFRQDLDDAVLGKFKKEVEIMTRMRHPNLLLLMGACTAPGKCALVMELFGGDVEKLLRDESFVLSAAQKVKMLKDVAQGMNWLHESKPPVLHRDLKPANLLVDRNTLLVKICDFGLSCVKNPAATKEQDTGGGTPVFMAPEVLLGNVFEWYADVYAFAITAWEVYTRNLAFAEFTALAQFKRAVCERNVRPPLPSDLPWRFQDLLESCWSAHVSQRPKFSRILSVLDQTLLEVAVADPLGQEFWKSAFPGSERIGFEKLCRKLVEGTSKSVESVSYLQFVLIDKHGSEAAQKEVKVENFGKMLSWFGPFAADRVVFLDQVKAIMKEPWFHGHLSSKEADNALANRKEGSFLVRLSESGSGAFAVSRVGSSGISHQRFQFNSALGTFTFKFSKGRTVSKICEKCSLSTFVLKHLAKELKLKYPCPGDPFGFLYGASAKLDKKVEPDGYFRDNDEDNEK